LSNIHLSSITVAVKKRGKRTLAEGRKTTAFVSVDIGRRWRALGEGDIATAMAWAAACR
jgi:hypothetical protein